MSKGIDRVKGSPVGGLGRPMEAVPVNIHPILRRFWNFAREMAKKFNKSLLKDHEDEFMKIIDKDFKNKD